MRALEAGTHGGCNGVLGRSPGRGGALDGSGLSASASGGLGRRFRRCAGQRQDHRSHRPPRAGGAGASGRRHPLRRGRPGLLRCGCATGDPRHPRRAGAGFSGRPGRHPSRQNSVRAGCPQRKGGNRWLGPHHWPMRSGTRNGGQRPGIGGHRLHRHPARRGCSAG